ncbi:hypothetical protein [Spirosoma endophyticum]|nr:hypothetical protein [Spirosoma endophyticum]
MQLKNNKRPHRSQFEQWLAQYKARMYESHFLELRRLGIDIEDWIESQASSPNILVIEDNPDE